MTSSKGVFSTLEASPIPHILMGNNVTLPVYEKGSVCIYDGIFNDVLNVPSLSANLLSISQITRSGSGKTVEFTTDSVFIQDHVTGGLIAIGTVDPSTHLYTFSHFCLPSPSLEHVSSHSQEHHVVQSRYLNLCIVLEILVLTTPPHLVDGFSLPQDPTSSLLDPPSSSIMPRDAVVAATPSLRIPFPLFLPYWSSFGLIRVPLL